MDEKDKVLILEFKRKIPLKIEKHLKRIIIFGSRVRDETVEDSDLDVIVLVDEKTIEIEKELEDIIYQLMWEYDFKPIISLKVFTELQFYNAVNKGFSFYSHVEREGISI